MRRDDSQISAVEATCGTFVCTVVSMYIHLYYIYVPVCSLCVLNLLCVSMPMSGRCKFPLLSGRVVEDP